MCGIVGVISQSNSISNINLKDNIEVMLNAIHHRGPDFQEIHSFENIHVGFARLAINGLNSFGNQPFSHNGIIVFCNGEIYNFKRLKQKYYLNHVCKSGSDIEIIPHLYERLGWNFLHEINGTFAMILIDTHKNEINLITDRLGKRPLYIFNYNGCIYFASELKAFMQAFDCEIDRENLATGMYFGYFPYPITPIKNSEKIPPACIRTINYRFMSSKEEIWYVLKPKDSKYIENIEDMEKHYQDLLEDAVSLRVEADAPVGAFLSGGLDSTSIVLKAYEKLGKRIPVFTGIVSGKEDSTDNVNTLKLATDYNLDFHKIIIDKKAYQDNLVNCCIAFDEIPFEAGTLNFLMISKAAKSHVKVLLDGGGGDEIFMGFPHQVLFSKKLPDFVYETVALFPKEPYLFLIAMAHKLGFNNGDPLIDSYLNVQQWFFHARAYVQNYQMDSGHFNYKKIVKNLDSLISKYCKGFGKKYDLNCLSYLDILGFTMRIYQLPDRMCMANSIEPREPFSDYRLWELFLGVDPKIKLEFGLKSYMRRLSKNLPSYLLTAKKDGFSSPVYIWFKDDPKFLRAVLNFINKNMNIARFLLGEKTPLSILKKWEDAHTTIWMDGVRLHMLLSILIWYKCYFENKEFLKNPTISLLDFMNA